MSEDPRLTATRETALDVALSILKEEGVLAVTHSSVGKKSGISRSTLYRHWPELASLRNAVFLKAATGPQYAPPTHGPFRTDLLWILSRLTTALKESDWGVIAPQLIAVAANNQQASELLGKFMQDRMEDVRSVLAAAESRGELKKDVEFQTLIEVFISVPYFRKFIAGLPLDEDWQKRHVNTICKLALEHEAIAD